MHYRIHHNTTYHYSEPVTLCHNLVHLVPRATPQQTCLRSQLLVTPVPASLTSQVDYFGNPTAFFTLQEPHQQMAVTTQHLVRLAPMELPDPQKSPPWEEVRHVLREGRSAPSLEAYHYTFDSLLVRAWPELLEYAEPSFPPGRPLLEGVLDLTRRIHADFRYDQKATTVATPLSEVMQHKHGVCQDFAHLQIGCLRSLGLAARYVSGYLLTRPPPGKERLVGADASHAWLAVYSPGHGWFDVDPTNNVPPTDKHLTLAWGRDYDDVSPIKGVILGGGKHSINVSVDVTQG